MCMSCSSLVSLDVVGQDWHSRVESERRARMESGAPLGAERRTRARHHLRLTTIDDSTVHSSSLRLEMPQLLENSHLDMFHRRHRLLRPLALTRLGQLIGRRRLAIEEMLDHVSRVTFTRCA